MTYQDLEIKEIELTNEVNSIFEKIIETKNEDEKQSLREIHDIKAKELRKIINLKDSWEV